MTEPRIRLGHVWKRFRIGLRGFRAFRTRLDRRPSSVSDGWVPPFIWALVDASLSVADGEAVGLIGPNGSGKSTALRLISGVATPWSGTVDTRGRVGALIELRAGLHPELTGRENVLLYGSLLGLKRKEVKRRFEEIVAFAELDRFIDTPLKRYSTGMEIRLGFSVAAHLDPDVLLVDEVLAVGDERFQRKCIARMEALRAEGQTLVFVSHDLDQVRQVCSRTILLERGQVRADGPTDEVIETYLAGIEAISPS